MQHASNEMQIGEIVENVSEENFRAEQPLSVEERLKSEKRSFGKQTNQIFVTFAKTKAF